MAWMILNPRELDAVRDAIMRARTCTGDPRVEGYWLTVQRGLKGDELTVDASVVVVAKQQAGDWKSGFQVAYRAIVSASDRH